MDEVINHPVAFSALEPSVRPSERSPTGSAQVLSDAGAAIDAR